MIRGSGQVMRGFDHGFMVYGQNGWMGWLPIGFHLFFCVAIIVLAVIFMRRHASKVRAYRKLNDPALLILRERYAHGELETEEFIRRKNDLKI
ncbi:hypothetical protein UF75_1658 [Desulfosporosinus sp. I2]|uniref:SHOCT domain-containing protein n=1 Tax=Desulfosporosinus sp. I2 TaxID=1617025 RepID=UPI0005F08846|nr:SHOCT domain-containing protein [Desulfosporosinus sp. I2]KJR47984.1 hypothetical protein UF75_1658 [Desulfosporosinus sp. I2]